MKNSSSKSSTACSRAEISTWTPKILFLSQEGIERSHKRNFKWNRTNTVYSGLGYILTGNLTKKLGERSDFCVWRLLPLFVDSNDLRTSVRAMNWWDRSANDKSYFGVGKASTDPKWATRILNEFSHFVVESISLSIKPILGRRRVLCWCNELPRHPIVPFATAIEPDVYSNQSWSSIRPRTHSSRV